ncbi:linear amide C-N hydrolase [Hafnia alvei]|uniref:Choloylglycine hydrolase n=1 Tax=Hafnia alvei TaxID=569 RepID=A0A1C6YVF0_HAFAL|nr:linear amide C-N hydrolase [Hafnia alvei]SCM50725.1 choloylglycine hydrolase [Hafnia alvei]
MHLNILLSAASLLICSVGMLFSPQLALACTRAVYQGEDKLVMTGRTMDWKEDLHSDLWIFPRGMARSGNAGPNSVEWVSKYGSVTTAAYNIATTDGMNEKGLVANMLWLAESQYPKPSKDKPSLSLAAWAQYTLDNFATVDEAVKELQSEPFVVVTGDVPGQPRLATIHLALSDASGDSAIFEYIDGKLVIHHSPEYQILTNSPTYDQQLAIDKYWEGIGGNIMLPGTNRAADRFVRAKYYINAIPKFHEARLAVSSVLSVMRSVSVPFGITSQAEPNISSTRWRTISDQKNKLYYFESSVGMNTFWVDLKRADLSAESPVRKLSLGVNQMADFNGEVSHAFEPAKPFEFLAAVVD